MGGVYSRERKISLSKDLEVGETTEGVSSHKQSGLNGTWHSGREVGSGNLEYRKDPSISSFYQVWVRDSTACLGSDTWSSLWNTWWGMGEFFNLGVSYKWKQKELLMVPFTRSQGSGSGVWMREIHHQQFWFELQQVLAVSHLRASV